MLHTTLKSVELGSQGLPDSFTRKSFFSDRQGQMPSPRTGNGPLLVAPRIDNRTLETHPAGCSRARGDTRASACHGTERPAAGADAPPRKTSGRLLLQIAPGPKPDVGNLHLRFDEGRVGRATRRLLSYSTAWSVNENTRHSQPRPWLSTRRKRLLRQTLTSCARRGAWNRSNRGRAIAETGIRAG
jgi:hypothetical protein